MTAKDQSTIPYERPALAPGVLQDEEGRTGNPVCKDESVVSQKQLLAELPGVHLNLLRRPRDFWALLRFRRSSAHGLLEVAVHGVVELALPLRQRQHVQVQRLPLSCSEIFPVPLLDRVLRFEVAEILEVETLVLAVELRRTLFAPVYDLVNISVDNETVYLCKCCVVGLNT